MRRARCAASYTAHRFELVGREPRETRDHLRSGQRVIVRDREQRSLVEVVRAAQMTHHDRLLDVVVSDFDVRHRDVRRRIIGVGRCRRSRLEHVLEHAGDLLLTLRDHDLPDEANEPHTFATAVHETGERLEHLGGEADRRVDEDVRETGRRGLVVLRHSRCSTCGPRLRAGSGASRGSTTGTRTRRGASAGCDRQGRLDRRPRLLRPPRRRPLRPRRDDPSGSCRARPRHRRARRGLRRRPLLPPPPPSWSRPRQWCGRGLDLDLVRVDDVDINDIDDVVFVNEDVFVQDSSRSSRSGSASSSSSSSSSSGNSASASSANSSASAIRSLRSGVWGAGPLTRRGSYATRRRLPPTPCELPQNRAWSARITFTYAAVVAFMPSRRTEVRPWESPPAPCSRHRS